MEPPKVDFDMATIGKQVASFVRARAIRLGSFIVYAENGQIIREDPRTGEKTILPPTNKKDECQK